MWNYLYLPFYLLYLKINLSSKTILELEVIWSELWVSHESRRVGVSAGQRDALVLWHHHSPRQKSASTVSLTFYIHQK
jgi:hypothetical protein